MTRVQFPNIAMTGNMFTSAPRVCARWPQQMSDDAILFVLRRLARPGHVWVCQKPQDKHLMLLPCARLTPRFSNCGVLADGWFSCCAGHHTVPRRFKSSSAGSSLFSKPASIVGVLQQRMLSMLLRQLGRCQQTVHPSCKSSPNRSGT